MYGTLCMFYLGRANNCFVCCTCITLSTGLWRVILKRGTLGDALEVPRRSQPLQLPWLWGRVLAQVWAGESRATARPQPWVLSPVWQRVPAETHSAGAYALLQWQWTCQSAVLLTHQVNNENNACVIQQISSILKKNKKKQRFKHCYTKSNNDIFQIQWEWIPS